MTTTLSQNALQLKAALQNPPLTSEQEQEKEVAALIQKCTGEELQALGLGAPNRPLVPRNLDKLAPRDRLYAVQTVISSLKYNHASGYFYNVEKYRPLNRILDTARDVLRDALPIKCIEAVFLGLLLTNPWEELERYPVGFKSRCEGGTYRHIVLAVHHVPTGKWGALGISRRSNLMFKPLGAGSLADLMADFKDSYAHWHHTLYKIRVGLPVEHEEGCTSEVCWRYCNVSCGRHPWDQCCAVLDKFAEDAKILASRYRVLGFRPPSRGRTTGHPPPLGDHPSPGVPISASGTTPDPDQQQQQQQQASQMGGGPASPVRMSSAARSTVSLSPAHRPLTLQTSSSLNTTSRAATGSHPAQPMRAPSAAASIRTASSPARPGPRHRLVPPDAKVTRAGGGGGTTGGGGGAGLLPAPSSPSAAAAAPKKAAQPLLQPAAPSTSPAQDATDVQVAWSATQTVPGDGTAVLHDSQAPVPVSDQAGPGSPSSASTGMEQRRASLIQTPPSAVSAPQAGQAGRHIKARPDSVRQGSMWERMHQQPSPSRRAATSAPPRRPSNGTPSTASHSPGLVKSPAAGKQHASVKQQRQHHQNQIQGSGDGQVNQVVPQQHGIASLAVPRSPSLRQGAGTPLRPTSRGAGNSEPSTASTGTVTPGCDGATPLLERSLAPGVSSGCDFGDAGIPVEAPGDSGGHDCDQPGDSNSDRQGSCDS